MLQDNYLFFPDNFPFENCNEFPENTQFINYQGERFIYKNNSDSLVIFYHGNAASGCAWGFLGDIFDDKNTSFLVSVYPGFSGDSRNPSISSIKEYVDVINEFTRDYNSIKLISYSIGSGALAYHASLRDIDGVFVISGFSSVSDVAQNIYPLYPVKLLLRDDFDNSAMMNKFNGNYFQVHGKNDRIVPIKFAEKLFETIRSENKRFLEIDQDHNTMFSTNEIFIELNNFLDK